MKTCARCGGGVAEPNEVTGWAGKWCHCQYSQAPLPYKLPQEEIDKLMESQAKSVQKPSISHIINLCEQLPKAELGALVNLLRELHARD